VSSGTEKIPSELDTTCIVERKRQMTQLLVNNKPYTFPPQSTLESILAELGWSQNQGMALALNQTVIQRKDWPTIQPREGDSLIVIKAVQGG